VGSDIRGLPLDVEVKSRKGFSPLAALKQAAKRRKPEHTLPPHVVLRMPGQGELSVGLFLAVRYLADDTAILAELVDLRAKVSDLESQKDFDQSRIKAVRRGLRAGATPYALERALNGVDLEEVQEVIGSAQDES
jgi:hypothetical protein